MLRNLLFSLLSFITIATMGQTALPTTPNSILMNEHVYTVSTTTTITADKAGEAGLRVRQNARVVINIKKDVTLTIKGADAKEGKPGMPGILVPESSTLVLIGDGNLVVTGGKASDGGNGESGQNAGGQDKDANFTYTYDKDMNFGGYGGAGGQGGYGAGAAIGGYGGEGGAGGARTASGTKDYNYSGLNGNPGSAGTASTGMGKVYVLGNVKVTANAGGGGSKGNAGAKNGYYGYTTAKDSNNRFYSIGGGGAGAGGGAGGAAAYAFGAGGTAGGGGGSGGQGGADYNNTYSAINKKTSGNWTFRLLNDMTTVNATCGAGTGSGGLGAANGAKLTESRDNGAGGQERYYIWIIASIPVGSARDVYANIGGEGGAAGAQGGVGTQGNLFKLNTATITSNTSKAAESITSYTSESQIPQEIRDLYEWALSFDAQGGSPVPATVKVVKGENLPDLAESSIPSKADSYFEGFYTEPVGGEKIYNHDGTVVAGSQVFTANKTLYAHWLDTKFTIVWDYSYIDKDGTRKVVKDEDRSRSANVKFNVADVIVVNAGDIVTPTSGSYNGHTIATATINAVVKSGVNTATTVYVTEEQLKTLSVTASAILSDANKYITTNVSSHEALMSAVPEGSYNQPWSITITNGIKPDVVNVKLLSSTSENGTYSVISQLENLSVACENNAGTYSGTYPVWPDNISYQKLYYKAQVVNYEIGGVAYSVANMPLTSNVSSNESQQTLTQSVALPILRLDLNAPEGLTPYYATGTKEYIHADAYGETINLSPYSAELTDNAFVGWALTDEKASPVESSIVMGGEKVVYAKWRDAVPPTIAFVGSETHYEIDEHEYVHGSLNVTIHIEDANDEYETRQWYYVAGDNTTTKQQIDDAGSWIEFPAGTSGDFVINIQETSFPLGFVYVKAIDADGNENFVISSQYKVDNQAPMILHSPIGKRMDDYSVVCADEDYPVIFVEVNDNIGVTNVIINGKDVTNGTNLPIGVTAGWTDPKAPQRQYLNSKLYELKKPNNDDREVLEYDRNGNPTDWGPVPDHKSYIISSRDAAGNTSMREMTVWVSHDWNKDANGKYIVEDAEEPYIDEHGNYVPGILPHVNCKHCSRYILAKKNGEWKKVDTDDPSQLNDVQLKPGDILLMNDKDIFAGTNSINEALTLAKETFYKEGTEDNPIGIASIVKFTAHPSGYGAKVDAVDLSNATLVDPDREIILDLNGQSIDNDGIGYECVTGNANVTILLTDNGELPYTNKSTVNDSPIKYVRTVSSVQAGKWQALYVPFDISKTADMELGVITGIEIGSSAYVELEATTFVAANTCAFVMNGEGQKEVKVTGVALNRATPSTNEHNGYQFVGCTDNSCVATEDRAFWVVTNGGKFNWAKAGAHQRPYRWVVYDNASTSAAKPSRSLEIKIVENKLATGIESISDKQDIGVYTLDGRKISSAQHLKQGIYIINGKKTVIR